MTKRSTPANIGRHARKAAKPRAKPATAEVANDVAAAPAPAPAAAPVDLTPEQVNGILSQQIGIARNAFFRLASVRAADLVKFEGKSWDDGAAYINAEMQGLDQQLAGAVPQPQGQG